MSPFCVKLETYLRMTKIPYQVALSDFREAPHGRIPYVKLDGRILGDSGRIIQELKRRHGDRLDQDLTPEQGARAVAIQRLIEDHTFRAMAWLRWSEPESWAAVKKVLIRIVPPMIAPVFGGLLLSYIRKSFLRGLDMQDYTRDEIIAMAIQDIEALSKLLGDQPYFLGVQAHAIDATAYGFLIQLFYVPWNDPVKEKCLKFKNLTDFCERMKARFWASESNAQTG